jgi:8-oxo-dGTP diphosphatase
MNSWYGLTPNEDDPQRIETPPQRAIQRIIPGSICYLVVDGCALLIRRNNPPHIGLWSPPGGKMNPGETPEETVMREVYEETGLTVVEPKLRAVVTVLHAGMGMQWLLLVYRSEKATGVLHPSDEGDISWAELAHLDSYPRPPADVRIFEHVMSNLPIAQFRYAYDQAENLVETVMG